MATAKVKIVARLRPRLSGEIDDGAVQLCHASDETGSSSSSSSATSSYISVANPRDPTTLFKFPCVYSILWLIHSMSDGVPPSFTSCYDESSTQEEIFQNDVRPLIDVVYNGIVSKPFSTT
jgi:kinesin family member 22